MPATLADMLAKILPRGEWKDLEIVQTPEGYMADKAVRARAVWRRFDKPVYIKAIRAADDSASVGTFQVANSERLARLQERLKAAAASGGPLVPIPFIELIDEGRWLLIAMDEVELAESRIASAPRVEDALRVLRSLGARSCAGWLHYDICPKNTGFLPSGAAVFIDPESYLQISEDIVDVSVGLHKPWRSPDHLRRLTSAGRGEQLAVAASAKHNFEVLLIAAELCIGTYPIGNCTQDVLSAWCSARPELKQLGDFWRGRLLASFSSEVPEPTDVAAELELFYKTQLDTVAQVDASCQIATASTLEHSTIDWNHDAMESIAETAADARWNFWSNVRSAVRFRRATPTQLRNYREQLLTAAAESPYERRLWVELLMCTLVWDSDAESAAAIATRALTYFPNDSEFAHDLAVARRSRDE